MHHKKLFFLLTACAGSLLFTNCSKEETTPEPTTQNPPVTASALCNGSTSRHYMPLKTGNSWTTNGDFGSGSVTKTITGDTVIQGKTYFVQSYKSSMSGETNQNFFRIDADGDLYEFRDYDNGSTSEHTKEYLFLPGDAETMVGYEWQFPGPIIHEGKMNKRMISSANESVKTSKCDYSGLLMVTEYDSDGKVFAKYYFKKGLGKVRETVFSNQDLNAVVLK